MSAKQRLRQAGRTLAMLLLVLVALVLGAYLMIFVQSLVVG